MSRIGKMPVVIPQGVKVNINENPDGVVVEVQGPKGKLEQKFHPTMNVYIDKWVNPKDGKEYDAIFVRPKEDINPKTYGLNKKKIKALWGTTRALINNMVKGVTEGWKVVLEIHGLGYRASVKGNTLELHLGYSHPIHYQIPEGIKISVVSNKQKKIDEIHVEGIDKYLVGQVAAIIRDFRKPDAYKGKGIRYADEVLRLKPGKAAKK
ncbi:MAG: 50S ribosomal protein L6 [Gammaproteobacteria bacterium]|nr:MAG: 50S ribosomal protein L6 [Gammaproteobacteria bacterium]RTZ68025.1 MAG: 50S ribosomal protein L6 [Aquificaceae bacterium]